MECCIASDLACASAKSTAWKRQRRSSQPHRQGLPYPLAPKGSALPIPSSTQYVLAISQASITPGRTASSKSKVSRKRFVGTVSSSCVSANELMHWPIVKSFPTLTDAERFLAGENLPTGGTSSSSLGGKFYAVKNGRVPGIYTDWPSAQEQITGWQKPKHRSFATRAEAQRFLDESGPRTGDSPEATEVESTISINQHPSESPSGNAAKPAPKKAKKTLNGASKSAKSAAVEYNEADYKPGTGPLPPGAEDNFDPNIILDSSTGTVVYKTQEQRQATKPNPAGLARSGTLRIHTDGSALRNGGANAFAGVGVYFGPGDRR